MYQLSIIYQMKVALVHDQLQEFGGAERVLLALTEIFPEADVYTSFYNPKKLGKHAEKFKHLHIHTSWADKIPWLKNLYSPFRFIAPYIWEQFDLNAYDLVISSSGMYMSKGVITRPETLHICYIHHQPKHLYHYETAAQLQKILPIKIYASLVNHSLRMWDYVASTRPDYFIANSQETQKRVQKFYRRESVVIYPPVTVPNSKVLEHEKSKSSYYLTTSRLARIKHIDLLVRAANTYGFNLKVIGTGREEEHLKSIAGKTVSILGSVSDEEFADIYSHARAFLFAGVDEEFGIAPVEAMGYGLPVIAYASGGLKETVIDNKNGYLFTHLEEEALYEKIRKLESLPEKEYEAMRKTAYESATQYEFSAFKRQILALVKEKMIKK